MDLRVDVQLQLSRGIPFVPFSETAPVIPTLAALRAQVAQTLDELQRDFRSGLRPAMFARWTALGSMLKHLGTFHADMLRAILVTVSETHAPH